MIGRLLKTNITSETVSPVLKWNEIFLINT
jgi:hypothetical protein